MSGEQLPGIYEGQPMEDARQVAMDNDMDFVTPIIDSKPVCTTWPEEITRDRVSAIIDGKNGVVSHKVQRATQKA